MEMSGGRSGLKMRFINTMPKIVRSKKLDRNYHDNSCLEEGKLSTKTDPFDFIPSFDLLLNDIFSKYKKIIILGYFNIKFLKYFTWLEELSCVISFSGI